MAIRITCINKDNGYHQNPHEAITDFGWLDETNNQTGKSTLIEMVDFLEHGGVAYVRAGQRTVTCYVRTSSRGRKFIQTHADGTPTDNLLQLPECVG